MILFNRSISFNNAMLRIWILVLLLNRPFNFLLIQLSLRNTKRGESGKYFCERSENKKKTKSYKEKAGRHILAYNARRTYFVLNIIHLCCSYRGLPLGLLLINFWILNLESSLISFYMPPTVAAASPYLFGWLTATTDTTPIKAVQYISSLFDRLFRRGIPSQLGLLRTCFFLLNISVFNTTAEIFLLHKEISQYIKYEERNPLH